METINIHEAKTRLSQLLEEVQKGHPFIIAKAGKPIARVTSVDAPAPEQAQRTGFLRGEIQVPEDFDRMGGEEIRVLFEDEDAPSS